MCSKWNKWALNDGDSNLGHMPYFKNYIIPPSLKSLNIMRGWENGHLNSILFILGSFCIWMTIKWQKRHLEMSQIDRDEPGMRVIKMSGKMLDITNLSFHHHSVIPASSWQDVQEWVEFWLWKDESSAVSYRRQHWIRFLRDNSLL